MMTSPHYRHDAIIYFGPFSKFDQFWRTPGVKRGAKIKEKGQKLPYPSEMIVKSWNFAHDDFSPLQTWCCHLFLLILKIWPVLENSRGQNMGQNQRKGSKLALPFGNDRPKLKFCTRWLFPIMNMMLSSILPILKIWPVFE